VIDHFAQFGLWNTAFDLHRIPMLLVHVITGSDLLVTIAQLKGEIGIAFKVRSRWNFIERHQREHFSRDFEDKNSLTERRSLSHPRFR